ncbi:hypothetical protein [Vibrio phage phiKT1024]|nr:hypothetical protein [Vibrio phage phiKT1024]
MNLYLYILVDPDKTSRCKVGITKNPDQRIKAYKTANPECYFSVVYIIPDRVHEKKVLSLLKEIFTVKSEYVHSSPKIVQNIIEGYLDDNEIDY